nr:hypothetical protein CFP56_00565 [Quercus suber]
MEVEGKTNDRSAPGSQHSAAGRRGGWAGRSTIQACALSAEVGARRASAHAASSTNRTTCLDVLRSDTGTTGSSRSLYRVLTHRRHSAL